MSSRKKINFVVHPTRDADLIAFLAAQPNMSEFIRTAIYDQMGRRPAAAPPAFDPVDLGDLVRQAVRAEFAIAQFALGGEPPANTSDDAATNEDPDVTAMIEGLFG